MEKAASEPRQNGLRSRWVLAYIWIAGLTLYCAALLLVNKRQAVWVNDLAWTLASAIAAATCFHTARFVAGPRRRAWLLLALGCTSWFIGQLHWNYSQLVLEVSLPFPSIGQLFYSAFAVFAIAVRMAAARIAQPYAVHVQAARQHRPRHLLSGGHGGARHARAGAADRRARVLSLDRARAHACSSPPTFLVALYALWTYRWGASWTPMLHARCRVHASTRSSNLIYAHSLLTGSYLPDDLINVSWLVDVRPDRGRGGANRLGAAPGPHADGRSGCRRASAGLKQSCRRC